MFAIAESGVLCADSAPVMHLRFEYEGARALPNTRVLIGFNGTTVSDADLTHHGLAEHATRFLWNPFSHGGTSYSVSHVYSVQGNTLLRANAIATLRAVDAFFTRLSGTFFTRPLGVTFTSGSLMIETCADVDVSSPLALPRFSSLDQRFRDLLGTNDMRVEIVPITLTRLPTATKYQNAPTTEPEKTWKDPWSEPDEPDDPNAPPKPIRVIRQIVTVGIRVTMVYNRVQDIKLQSVRPRKP